MTTEILTDAWFIQLAANASNYKILIGIVSAMLSGLVKVWAIRHPEAPNNKIWELIQVLVGLNVKQKSEAKPETTVVPAPPSEE